MRLGSAIILATICCLFADTSVEAGCVGPKGHAGSRSRWADGAIGEGGTTTAAAYKTWGDGKYRLR